MGCRRFSGVNFAEGKGLDRFSKGGRLGSLDCPGIGRVEFGESSGDALQQRAWRLSSSPQGCFASPFSPA